MAHYALRGMYRYLRCPYEERLDRLSDIWRITPEECLDMAVHDAVTMVDSVSLREGRTLDLDSATTLFWDAWDRHIPDVVPAPEDSLGLIRFGERCIRNHSAMGPNRDGRVVAVGVSATVPLGEGSSVTVPLDVIRMSGDTVTMMCYRTDPGIRSSDELSRDMGMLLGSRWVLSNISGCTHVRLVWMFLSSGVRVEAIPDARSMKDALENASSIIDKMENHDNPLPRESEHCSICPYQSRCPRKAHERHLSSEQGSMDKDAGVALVDEYAEVQERVDALKRRLSDLERRRDAVSGRIVDYADSNGFMSLKGHGCSVLVRHERKVELPDDKGPMMEILRSRGLYDSCSMPNWSRIRAEIAKGTMDPEVSRLAKVTDGSKVHFRRDADRRRWNR